MPIGGQARQSYEASGGVLRRRHLVRGTGGGLHGAVDLVLGGRQRRRHFEASGERTCNDCHKGIAHKLPDMTGVPGWDVSIAN